MLALASERLDSLRLRAGGERLYQLFRHLGTEGRHLCSNRGMLMRRSCTFYVAQALPARAYMYLTSPARILETFEAFALCMGH